MSEDHGDRAIRIAIGIAFVLIAAVSSFLYFQSGEGLQASTADVTFAAGPPPKPEYGWRKLTRSGYSLDHAATRFLLLPQDLHGAKVQIEMEAESAVDFAVEHRAVNADNFDHAAFPKLHCAQREVLAVKATCELSGADNTLILRDSRGPIGAIAGVLGLAKGGSTASDRMTAANRVFVTLYAWDCIKHCS